MNDQLLVAMGSNYTNGWMNNPRARQVTGHGNSQGYYRVLTPGGMGFTSFPD